MPLKQQHIRQAERNREFWESHYSADSPFLEWVVASMFYEAVHWVEAYLDGKGMHSATHQVRDATIRRDPGLIAMAVDYNNLKIASQKARYECYAHTKEEIREALIPLIDRIREHIAVLL